MNLPFTVEQFLDVFGIYNQAVWPMQIFLYVFALIAIVLAIKKFNNSDRIISIILAFFWLWIGIVYHFVFFSSINKSIFLKFFKSLSKIALLQMKWGIPQPETVKDYVIEGLVDGQWQELIHVTGNYQRLKRHNLPSVIPVQSIRINIIATNGLNHARVCEVRVYGVNPDE